MNIIELVMDNKKVSVRGETPVGVNWIYYIDSEAMTVEFVTVWKTIYKTKDEYDDKEKFYARVEDICRMLDGDKSVIYAF